MKNNCRIDYIIRYDSLENFIEVLTFEKLFSLENCLGFKYRSKEGTIFNSSHHTIEYHPDSAKPDTNENLIYIATEKSLPQCRSSGRKKVSKGTCVDQKKDEGCDGSSCCEKFWSQGNGDGEPANKNYLCKTPAPEDYTCDFHYPEGECLLTYPPNPLPYCDVDRGERVLAHQPCFNINKYDSKGNDVCNKYYAYNTDPDIGKGYYYCASDPNDKSDTKCMYQLVNDNFQKCAEPPTPPPTPAPTPPPPTPAPTPPPTPAPSPNGWSCVNSKCVQKAGGDHPSQVGCLENCPTPPPAPAS